MSKFRKYLLPVIILFIFPLLLAAQEPSVQYYQLKIYSFDKDSQIPGTEEYLKTAFLPTLKRLNIKDVGVFKPKADSLKQLFVLIPFSSLDEMNNLNEKLLKDELYLENGKEYLSASYDNPPYKRIEIIVMRAFADMPFMRPSPLNTPRKERIYELRSYQSPTEAYFQNKLEMFNEGGEIKLFDRLGFNAVFYGEVLAGPHTPNLMYLISFPNQESHDKHWENFGNSPEWKKLTEMDKYKNTVSHIDAHFLYPTEYSDY